MTSAAPDFALAVDIGGTKAAFARISADGGLLSAVEKHPVPFTSQGAADPDGLLALIRPYVEAAKTAAGCFRGIGLSLCGNIDLDSGMAVLVPNLHWRYLPFGQMVRDTCQVDVFAATDVRMAVLAEALWGAARNVRYFAWATVGTGYGGYLFLDGKLYAGTHGYAGNFGHATWDEKNGILCGCGRYGCVETYVAGPAIARAGQAAADQGNSPFLQAIAAARPVSTADVLAAEAAGDPSAHQIIEQVIRLISINLGGVTNTLDLDMIVLGGGVVQACPGFAGRVSRRIRDFLMTEEAKRDLRVVKETFENSALIGAAADVFYRQGMVAENWREQ
jgi:glucokinase